MVLRGSNECPWAMRESLEGVLVSRFGVYQMNFEALGKGQRVRELGSDLGVEVRELPDPGEAGKACGSCRAGSRGTWPCCTTPCRATGQSQMREGGGLAEEISRGLLAMAPSQVQTAPPDSMGPCGWAEPSGQAGLARKASWQR